MKSTRSGGCPAGPQEAGLMGQPNGNVNWYIYFKSRVFVPCDFNVKFPRNP